MILLLFSISGHWELLHESDYCSFFGIDFVDTLNGWVCGDYGMVWRTRDGGVSWETLYVTRNVTLYDICFLDTLTGWVCGDYGYIAKTTDGGNTWVEQNSGVLGGLKSIKFVDERHGWCGFDVSSKSLLRTIDGGENWIKILFLEGPYYFDNVTISAVNKNILWFLGRKLYVSYDGGNNWQLKISNVISGSCFAFDTSHIWFTSNKEDTLIVYRSNNGGNSFESTKVSVKLGAGNKMPIIFVDPMYGWSGGCFFPVVTEDGGKNFYEYSIPGDDWIEDIDFVDREHGWMCKQYPSYYPERNGEILRWVSDFPSIIDEGKETKTFFLIDKVRLEKGYKIFSLSGELVKEINTDFWDGKDENGNIVKTGIYFGAKNNKKVKIIKLGGSR